MAKAEFEISVKPEQLSAHTEQIVEQNGQLETSQGIENTRIRDLVQSDIGTEQIVSFYNLIKDAQGIPYDVIGGRILKLHNALDAVHDGFGFEKLRADAQLAQEIRPLRSEDILRIQAEEEEKVRAQLARRIQDEIDEIYMTLDTYGQAWPIPTALSGEDRKLLLQMIEDEDEAGADDGYFIEDIIPITPAERTHQAEIAERAKRVVENPDVSNLTVLYLASNVGKVITVEELTRFLYVADVEGNNHRTHITSILGPKHHGRRIQKMLFEEHGLHLQYGLRILRERCSDGQLKELRRTRIYIAVEDPAAQGAARTIEQQLNDTRLVHDVMDDVTIYRDSDVDTDSIAAIEATLIPKIEVPQESVVEEVPEEAAEVAHEKDAWVNDFRVAVQAGINQLITDSLFEEDVMRGSTIRTISSSTILGTRENRKRMLAAGLMRPGQAKSDDMDRLHRVIGALLNTQPKILGQRGKRQKQALAIINEMIEENLKKLETEANVG